MDFAMLTSSFLAILLALTEELCNGAALPFEKPIVTTEEFVRFQDKLWSESVSVTSNDATTTYVHNDSERKTFDSFNTDLTTAFANVNGDTTTLVLVTDSKGKLIYQEKDNLDSLGLNKAPDCEDECMSSKDFYSSTNSTESTSSEVDSAFDADNFNLNITLHPSSIAPTDIENLEIITSTDEVNEEGSTIGTLLNTAQNDSHSYDNMGWTFEIHTAETTSSFQFTGTDTSEELKDVSGAFDDLELISSTSESTDRTVDDLTLGDTTEVNSISALTTDVENSCPPPGICFWFLSQDVCSVNANCSETQICCKIRCSKICISA